MANTATPLTAIRATMKMQPSGLITPVVCVFDTTGQDLTLFTPAAGRYAAVVGMKYAEASAHTLTWKSGAAPATQTTLVTE